MKILIAALIGLLPLHCEPERPAPKINRPLLSWSTVASDRASSSGGYHAPASTLVPRRMRSVIAARNARVARASSERSAPAAPAPSRIGSPTQSDR